jgi:hypothetical protein
LQHIRNISAVRHRLLPLVFLLVILGACSGDEEAEPPAPPPATTGTDTQPPSSTTPPESVVAPLPGPTLEEFVAAARAGDSEAMWALLSTPTRERLGPTPAKFRRGEGRRLRTNLGSFIEGRSAVFLNEQVSADFAVAAFGGRQAVGGKGRRGAFAAALRYEDGEWRVELGGPVKLEALVPDPGMVENENSQVAAGVVADAAILEGGLWLDGEAVGGESGGTDDRHITFFSDPVTDLERGPHAAIAFASTAHDASALAWLFSVRRS